jgi:hypothetical protein
MPSVITRLRLFSFRHLSACQVLCGGSLPQTRVSITPLFCPISERHLSWKVTNVDCSLGSVNLSCHWPVIREVLQTPPKSRLPIPCTPCLNIPPPPHSPLSKQLPLHPTLSPIATPTLTQVIYLCPSVLCIVWCTVYCLVYVVLSVAWCAGLAAKGLTQQINLLRPIMRSQAPGSATQAQLRATPKLSFTVSCSAVSVTFTIP